MAAVLHRWFTGQDVPYRHGCQGFVIYIDARLAKALSHPLRQQILRRLAVGGVASPNQLARALVQPLPNVSYHVRILRQLDCVELVRTAPSAGALEHFYRATIDPGLDDEQWSRLPAALRRGTLDRSLSTILESASKAGREAGFDGPESHASRVELSLDEQGRRQIVALLAGTLDAVRRIHAEGASRRTRRGADSPPIIAPELAIVHLRRDPPTR